jgi:uncharacterized protein (TIGR02646 family)
MKHSKKNSSPQELVNWIASFQGGSPPKWEKINLSVKGRLKNALLKEQGWVCAYCGKSVGKESGNRGSGNDDKKGDNHIEHFIPKSTNKNCTYDYGNLFISCGPSNGNGAPKTCGDAKENRIPTDPANLIPSHPDCEKRFRYDGGAVNPANSSDQHVIDAIAALNLNETSLCQDRGKILAGLEADILAGEITAENVTDEISSWRARDVDGRCKNFGHVAARYLEEELL